MLLDFWVLLCWICGPVLIFAIFAFIKLADKPINRLKEKVGGENVEDLPLWSAMTKGEKLRFVLYLVLMIAAILGITLSASKILLNNEDAVWSQSALQTQVIDLSETQKKLDKALFLEYMSYGEIKSETMRKVYDYNKRLYTFEKETKRSGFSLVDLNTDIDYINVSQIVNDLQTQEQIPGDIDG